MMGATLFTINVRLSPAQVLYTINHGAPDLIIVHRDFMPLIDEVKSGFERDIKIIPIGDGDGYEAWIGQAADRFDFPDFDEARTATLFYTTGTTGNPKGVSYSHRQLVLHTLGLLAGLAHGPVMLDFIAVTFTCRSRLYFTFMAGGFLMPQRCWGCDKSIPVAMTLIPYCD
jgi:fatty-acyl-CoA synthase